MDGVRRCVFLAWAVLLGVSTYPGLMQALRLRLRGDPAAWRKFRLNIAALREVAWTGAPPRAVGAGKLLNAQKTG
jgi:hypothetical protein